LVLPELQEAEIDNLEMLKATCIKFVYMFRNQLPVDHIVNYLQLFTGFLNSMHPVNQSYAAACIDKLLVRTHPQTN